MTSVEQLLVYLRWNAYLFPTNSFTEKHAYIQNNNNHNNSNNDNDLPSCRAPNLAWLFARKPRVVTNRENLEAPWSRLETDQAKREGLASTSCNAAKKIFTYVSVSGVAKKLFGGAVEHYLAEKPY